MHYSIALTQCHKIKKKHLGQTCPCGINFRVLFDPVVFKLATNSFSKNRQRLIGLEKIHFDFIRLNNVIEPVSNVSSYEKESTPYRFLANICEVSV